MSKIKRPPILVKKSRKGGGNRRGFYYNEKFIEVCSPLTYEELTEDIAKGFDSLEKEEGGKKQIKNRIKNRNQAQLIDLPEVLSKDGLYDDQIERIAAKLDLPKHGYLGTYPIDKIHTIADKLKEFKSKIKQFGFIFNTDPSNKPGQHWIAVCYIRKLQELDYYNSLAEQPTDQFREQIKPVIDELSLPYYLKFKVNMIPRQDKSTNCGYHALDFLYRLLVLKEKFKFATGYSDVREGEKDINKFKKSLDKFGYIA